MNSKIALALLGFAITLRGVELEAQLGQPQRYNRSKDQFVYGDVWSTAWATDANGQDILFSAVDDPYGFQNEFRPAGCGASCGRNVAIVSFGNSQPPALSGRTINDLSFLGTQGQGAENGIKGENWKANGLTAIEGKLYLSISRHTYGQLFFDFRQRTANTTLLSSDDDGKTWHPMPTTVGGLISPVGFPGSNFSTAAFVHFGRDGALPPGVDPADEADRYVYAISTNGFWDNGDSLTLGRVLKTNILEPAAWEFVTGFDASEHPVWTRGAEGLAHVRPILSAPGRVSMTGMQYVPALKRYILPEWHFPLLDSTCAASPARPFVWGTGGFSDPEHTCIRTSRWQFYEAPHPWGPWTLFFDHDFTPGSSPDNGFYHPQIVSKFIAPAVDAEGWLTMWVLGSGNFASSGKPWDQTAYTLYEFPLRVRVKPQVAR